MGAVEPGDLIGGVVTEEFRHIVNLAIPMAVHGEKGGLDNWYGPRGLLQSAIRLDIEPAPCTRLDQPRCTRYDTLPADPWGRFRDRAQSPGPRRPWMVARFGRIPQRS